jgi:acyl-CoA synthetase (AMP-forming)/AMP-acid ligase II
LPPFRAIPDLIRENAGAHPRQLALRQGAARLTWGELDAQVDRIAGRLQAAGLAATQSIAICGANSIPYLVLFLGGLRAGLAVAPLPTGTTAEQLAGMVRDSGACLFFTDGQVPPLAPEVPRIRMDLREGPGSLLSWLDQDSSPPQPVRVEPGWPFNIIYSSGTTGTPKGIVQPHAMRWAHVARGENYGYGPDAVALVATSLCSNTTLVSVFPALAKGGAVVMTEGRFDPQSYLALAQEVRATHAMLVPVQYQRLLAAPEFDRHDLSSFRMKFCTSAPFSGKLKADVLARWPGGLVEYYGMTEGGGTCILEAHHFPHKLHTVGRPAEGHDIRLIAEDGRELPRGETGEVVGRSASMMTAYPGSRRRRAKRSGTTGRAIASSAPATSAVSTRTAS